MVSETVKTFIEEIRGELSAMPKDDPDRDILEAALSTARLKAAGKRDAELKSGPIADYSKDPFNPEVVTKTWDQVWRQWHADDRTPYRGIGPCPLSGAQLETLGKRIPSYVHGDYSHSQTLYYFFTETFPKLDDNEVIKQDRYSGTRRIGNTLYQYGWMTTDSDFFVPNPGFTKDQIEDLTTKVNLEPMTLNSYVITAEFMNLLNGSWLDSGQRDSSGRILKQQSSTYLLGSYFRIRFGKDIKDINLRANYNQDGTLRLDPTPGFITNPCVGLRTVGDNALASL